MHCLVWSWLKENAQSHQPSRVETKIKSLTNNPSVVYDAFNKDLYIWRRYKRLHKKLEVVQKKIMS